MDSQSALPGCLGTPDVEAPRPRTGTDARLALLLPHENASAEPPDTQHIDVAMNKELEPEPKSEPAHQVLLEDTQPGPSHASASCICTAPRPAPLFMWEGCLSDRGGRGVGRPKEARGRAGARDDHACWSLE